MRQAGQEVGRIDLDCWQQVGNSAAEYLGIRSRLGVAWEDDAPLLATVLAMY